MPNAIIVVGQSENNIHIAAAKYTAAKLSQEGYTPSFINTMATDDKNVIKYHMQQAKPDLAVTFDCAGFDLELLGGDLFYNSLCCPAAHILLKPPFTYGDSLCKRMNFTMDFYTLGQSDAEYLRGNYRRVPYAKIVEPPIGKPSSDRRERQLGIVIAGSYDKPAEVYERMRLCAGTDADLFGKIADRLCEGRKSIYAIAVELGVGQEIFCRKPDAAMLAIEYARVMGLKNVADALIKINVPFAVCAPGWKENFSYSGLICISRQQFDAEQMIQVYGMSAIVIDCNPGKPDTYSVACMMASACGAEAVNVTEWKEADFYNRLRTLI